MNTSNLIILSQIKGIGSTTLKFIAREFNSFQLGSPMDYLDLLSEAKNKNRRVHIPSKEEVFEAYNNAELLVEESQNYNIKTISILDEEYPKRFYDLKDHPAILYVKGNLEALNYKYNAAIIGTREPSNYGYRTGERLSSILTKNSFQIVSGLAIGCDSAAHLGCVNSEGASIAVLANPLNTVYPKENKSLADKIIDFNGCLVSEYPIGTRTRPEFFVARDRLQSGISDFVIVIETDVKGGTMHTVGFAQEQNRGLYCIFSHPEDLRNQSKFQGNKYLVESKKAIPIITGNDIEDLIKLYKEGSVSKDVQTIFNDKGQGELF